MKSSPILARVITIGVWMEIDTIKPHPNLIVIDQDGDIWVSGSNPMEARGDSWKGWKMLRSPASASAMSLIRESVSPEVYEAVEKRLKMKGSLPS